MLSTDLKGVAARLRAGKPLGEDEMQLLALRVEADADRAEAMEAVVVPGRVRGSVTPGDPHVTRLHDWATGRQPGEQP